MENYPDGFGPFNDYGTGVFDDELRINEDALDTLEELYV